MDLAMEVQQTLPSQKPLQLQKLDIVGKSIYCHETDCNPQKKINTTRNNR